MLCMVLGTLRAFSVSDSPLDNPTEICDLWKESVAQHGLSIINTQGLDMSYGNLHLVSQPSHVFCLVNIQEKNSKVAEALVCVWDSVTSPLALGCPG